MADVSDSPALVPPRLDGRYTVIRSIGKGAQARVYLGWDANIEGWRALKVLATAYLEDDAVRARFAGEATMMARLTHPNVMTVMDVDVDGPLPYMVMDLARGGSVVDWMRRNGRMPPRMATEVIVACCAALEYTHAQGIVHRDVKPHNILLHEDGRPILTDFGIARADDAAQLTANGAAMGTFAFMPPEQRADAHSVTEVADVYALGATFYTMLTARTSTELFLADTRDKLLDGVPDELRPIVLTACRYEPEGRYPSIAAMREAIEAAAQSLPEDPPSAPLYEERIPLPPSLPMWLEPDSGAEELARYLTPAEEQATVLYYDMPRKSDPGSNRGRTDPGLRGGKTDPGRSGKTDPGLRSGKTDSGRTNPGKATIEQIAAAIPYQMPSSGGRRSVPPVSRGPSGDDQLPDYLDRDALQPPQTLAPPTTLTATGPAPTPPPAKPKPEPAPPPVPRVVVSEEPPPAWRRAVLPAVAAVLLLALLVGGTGVYSVRSKAGATDTLRRTRAALVSEVSRAEGLSGELGVGGADTEALRNAYFVFQDAPKDQREAAAVSFAKLAVKEADRLGPRERGQPQVVELRKKLRDTTEAEQRYDAARTSLLGRVTGSLGTR